MGLSILDWVILLIIVLSVLQAIAQGFFYEFFSLAGVIVGYLLAAWEYPRVAAWYAPHVNSEWVADIAAFFTIFFVVVLLAGVLGRIARWAVHGVGLRWFDRFLGGAFGFLRGAVVSTVVGAGAGGFYAAVGAVAAIANCSVATGERPRFDLGGAGGIAAALSPGLGPVANRSSARAYTRQRQVIVAGEIVFTYGLTEARRERRRERSTGSSDPADVQKWHNVFRGRV